MNIDKNISAEKIIHMDIQSNNENIFTIGWCMDIIAEFHFNGEKLSRINEEIYLKLIQSHNIKTFKYLQDPKYTDTLNLLLKLTNV